MISVVFDTNAYTAFKQGKADAIDIVQRAPQIILNSVVIGELLAGFAIGSREVQNRQELQQFMASQRVRIVVIDEQTASFYASIYQDLRANGKPIPTNDMWIAATGFQYNAVLFSLDKHFRSISGLTVGATAQELGLP